MKNENEKNNANDEINKNKTITRKSFEYRTKYISHRSFCSIKNL